MHYCTDAAVHVTIPLVKKPIGPEEAAAMLTVDQVARYLGVKPRTVIDHVVRGKLHPVKYQRPGVGGGPVSLFDRDEVQTLLEERAAAKTELVPAGDPGPLVRSGSPGIVRIPQHRAIAVRPLSIDRKRYLLIDEAVEYTGLGRFYIEEHVQGQPIGPRRALAYRRSELDKL